MLSKKITSLLKQNWLKVFSVTFLFLFFGAYADIFAIASPYNPGETLDPTCLPGEVNCTVLLSSGGSSPWQESGDDIYFDTGKVGIGTDSPTSNLTLKGSVETIGSELITNGTFDTDASGWNLYDSGSYNNGKVTLNIDWDYSSNAYVSTEVYTESGKTYLITFTASDLVNELLEVFFDENYYYSGDDGVNFGEGYHSIVFVSDYTGVDNLYFTSYYWNDDSSWSIDNVSMKEIDSSSLVSPLSLSDFKGDRLFSFGEGDNINSFFLGSGSGNSSTSVDSSFVGLNAGSSVSLADSSNFFGKSAGSAAQSPQDSNFIGTEAGSLAIGPQNSNFIGNGAGRYTENALSSNFIGSSAGSGSNNPSRVNFIGNLAGNNAHEIVDSNFIGYNSGYAAYQTTESNFMGTNTGRQARVTGSNFIGDDAGAYSTYASYSNFLGWGAGRNSGYASNAIFIGNKAGYYDTVNNSGSIHDWSVLVGYNTKTGGYKNSILLGGASSTTAITNTKDNQFMLAPTITEMRLRGIDYTLPSTIGTYSERFYLQSTGGGVLSWIESPGLAAVNTSNIFQSRLNAGSGVTSTTDSIFLGWNAGSNATSASDSNFFGSNSGVSATNSMYSNFFGMQSGYQATSASNSNFFGRNAGQSATNSSNSNFFGYQSGYQSSNASNSIFIGQSSGYQDTVNNTGNVDDFSILIGKSTSTGGFSNSIALGGSATNTATNQMMVGSTTRPINNLVVKGATSTCTIDTAGGALSCTSDERLKTNIADLDTNVLKKLLQIRTVNYSWLNGDSDKTNIGFLAQDLEQYFPELVSTDSEGYKSVYYANMTPILVEAIREMDLKLSNFDDLEKDNTWRDSFVSWFGNATNEIREFIAGTLRARNQICIGEGEEEVCITKDDLIRMKEGVKESSQNTNEPIVENIENENADNNENDTTPVEGDEMEEENQNDNAETDQDSEGGSGEEENKTEVDETTSSSSQDDENMNPQNDEVSDTDEGTTSGENTEQ